MRKTIFFVFLVIVVISFGAEIKIKDVSPVLDIYEQVSFMIENKIMELDENGNFRGGLLTTRFDIAQYLYNVLKNFQLQDISKKLSSFEKNQQELSTKILGVEAAYKTYEQRMKDFENALTRIQNQFDRLSQEVYAKVREEFENALKDQKSEIARYEPLFSRMSAVEGLVSSLQKQLASSDKNLDLLNNKISVLEQTQSSMSSDIAALSSALAGMRNNTNELSSKVSANTQAIQKLKDDVNVQLYAQGKLFDQKLLDLSTKLDILSKSLQNELSIQKKTLTDYEQNLMAVESQVDELRQNMKMLETLASKEELSALQTAISSVSKKVENVELNLQSLEQRIEGTQVDSLQRKISELELKQKDLEGSLMTAYLLGGAGIVVGLIAVIFAMGGF